MIRIFSGIFLYALAISIACATPQSAVAQIQDKVQQGCINTMNKNGIKVLATQGKENASCVKGVGAGKISGTADDCLTADGKNKVSKAEQKTTDGETSKCVAPLPSFGLTSAAAVNAAAKNGELELIKDVFGDPVDSAIIDASVDKAGAGCQAAISKAYEKLAATRAKTFVGCKKGGLKAQTITGKSGLADCLSDDTKGKVGKAKTKVTDTVTKKCSGVVPATAFPGDCSGSALNDLGVCIAELTECRTCVALARMDGIPETSCDVLDNGAADQSCAVCGDGVISAGEECDDGNSNSGDGCSSSCLCGPGSGEFGCQDTQCPSSGEIILLAGAGAPCASNGECLSGVCDLGGTGRCASQSELDTGWTGIAHDSDVNGGVIAKEKLVCPGPAPVCGECAVVGIDPEPGNCRCAGDNRAVCDEPFENDDDDCGGGLCNCYLGPPLPLSSGNTPACVVNGFAENISGTTNVDSGARQVTANLAAQVYLGILTIEPCPYCTGDVMANDGVRDGTCVDGLNDGETCDANAFNETFPAPGGDAHSLDCFPSPGKNVSGSGLKLRLEQTTGSVSLAANVPCGPGGSLDCFCSQCSGDGTIPCSSDADCAAAGAGVCAQIGTTDPLPNQCVGNPCVDVGGGEGECSGLAPDQFCDAVVRADGTGFISCITNADCDVGVIGIAAGDCSLSKTRDCFLDPIVATGTPDPDNPVSVAVFCAAKTSSPGINSVSGLPGPGRVLNEGVTQTFCDGDPGTAYTPGIGGCP